jgi:hypothetical protein
MLFGKKPAAEKVTYRMIERELNQVLARAETAHVNSHALADFLDACAQAIRVKALTTYRV